MTGQRHRDLNRILAATRTHEQLHGTLAHKWLLKPNNPLLRDLEKAIAETREALLDGGGTNSTSFIIRDAETRLKDASSEARVHAAMRRIFHDQRARILIPSAGVDHHETFVLAELGDE
jgi:hypothetical protein